MGTISWALEQGDDSIVDGLAAERAIVAASLRGDGEQVEKDGISALRYKVGSLIVLPWIDALLNAVSKNRPAQAPLVRVLVETQPQTLQIPETDKYLSRPSSETIV